MKKILVIEDEQDARRVLVRRLQAHRYEVVERSEEHTSELQSQR